MSTEIVPVENNAIAAPIDASNPVGGMYCSLKTENIEDRLEVFDAVSNAESLEDHIGEKLMVSDVIIQPVELVDKLTGEINNANRITLLADGTAYACVSVGVETALKQLFSIVGQPTWDPAIPLKAVKQTGNKGFKFTTLQLARDSVNGTHVR